MSRPIRSSSGRSASMRFVRLSLSCSVETSATDMTNLFYRSMADHLDLQDASDEQLDARVRTLMERMRPLEEELGRLRAQIQQVVSEQKKRERSLHLKSRMQVRTTVKEGQLPNLQQIAESSNDLVPAGAALRDLHFFRDSGTEIGLGYATAREPSLYMTN